MPPISRAGVPGGWLAGGVATQRHNLASQARSGMMDTRVIHRQFLRIIALVYAKPLTALPQAMPVFSSHPLRQAELERVGTPMVTEGSDG